MGSYIEKEILSLMINQLFFTTENLDILDLPLFKRIFNYLKKDDYGISIVNAADYLKKSADSLRGEYVIIITIKITIDEKYYYF